jgi:cell division protein ZapB
MPGLSERHIFAALSIKGIVKLPNVLTAIHLRHYSCAMTPDLNLLAEKIEQLATLTQNLRRENADLRLQMAAQLADRTELENRLQEACKRTVALLDKLPQYAENEEAA